ncbi:FtsB family cell division protein [Plantibacter sp. YIM 135347]|uniref:FtsB family cell division protein n=1 Tax=Plantibacter sp. YIM 135347 TaxID=3423919 RepID=UPI003D34AC60
MPQSNGPRKEPMRPGSGESAGASSSRESSASRSSASKPSPSKAPSSKAPSSKSSASKAPKQSPTTTGAGPGARPNGGRNADAAAAAGQNGTLAWLRSLRVSGFSILLIGILILGVIVIAPNLKTFVEQRQQIASLQQDVQRSQAEVDKLTEQRARWNDKTYVMSQARDKLFYALPGELSYIIVNDIDPATVPSNNAPVSDALVPTQSNWLQGMLSSLVASGFAPAPAPTPSTTPTEPPAPGSTQAPSQPQG